MIAAIHLCTNCFDMCPIVVFLARGSKNDQAQERRILGLTAPTSLWHAGRTVRTEKKQSSQGKIKKNKTTRWFNFLIGMTFLLVLPHLGYVRTLPRYLDTRIFLQIETSIISERYFTGQLVCTRRFVILSH